MPNHFRRSSPGDEIYTDEQERERAIRYSRTREWLLLVGMIYGVLTSALVLVTGFSARVRDRSEQLAPRQLGPVMPYSAVMLLLSSLASLPLSYLSGYVIEHRYNLSNQTRLSWLSDQLKGLGVSLVLALPLAQGAYAIIRRYPKRWWAILSGLTIPVTVVLVNLAPVLLMPIFNKFEPLKDRSLAKRLQDLAEAQGVHVSNVMQMDMSKQTKKANAFFTGLGNTKRIVLGDTLLDEFTAGEVEVVLAHELSHQVHRDLWKGIAVGALSSLVTFFSVYRFAPPLIQRWGRRWGLDPESGPADVAALPLLGLVGSVVSLVLGPILNGLTRATIEHPADRYALDLTGKRNAFISAMQKLGRMNLSDPHPPTIIKYLLYDHPPIHERIQFARDYKKES